MEYKIGTRRPNPLEKKRRERHMKLMAERRQRQLEVMQVPFLNEVIMDPGCPPSCTKEDFKRPRLRKFPFDIDSISFIGRLQSGGDVRTGEGLGGGLDGYNWKIRVGNAGLTYVLKLFWETEPDPPFYFAAQRECQNAALLQQIEAAVSDAAKADNQHGPILLDPDPKSQRDADKNLLAFSDEARQRKIGVESADLLHFSADNIPRLRKCYGWLQFTGEQLYKHLPWKLHPPYIEVDKMVRSIDKTKNYTAVVYEFVEEADNDPNVVKSVLEFLWRVGFSHCLSPRKANWKSSVLVDLSDIVGPRTFGWVGARYGPFGPEHVLR
ncbi:hypothetical protein VFPPC_07915 [Pochonia chlamydosporia 170]|uniref:Uncharacterized protein n=1 Tax=Pochonia chlamydosporia 170 TaxID=1380566 RepID=A0A179FL35_METCM|nr:hypothetical protein VFPPC_07915 [Pochonia chlamydosporia 170]OAQ66346.2 hypothetical protein VFPPC_07915 [Pochonia chlamydosporia 170]